MSTTFEHQITSPFFLLPAEIRNQIYAHLFTFPKSLSIAFPPYTNLQNEPSKPSLEHIPNALLINKQFTTEALPVLYGTNTFRTSTTSTLATFLHDIGPANRSHLKRLEASLWTPLPAKITITNSSQAPPSPSQMLVSTAVAPGMHTPTQYFAVNRINQSTSLGERRREAVGRSTASSTSSSESQPFTTFTSTAHLLPQPLSLPPLLTCIPNLQLFRIEIFARVTPRPSPRTIAIEFEDLFRGLYERFMERDKEQGKVWDQVFEVVRFDGIERELGKECVKLGHKDCVALMLGSEREEWVGELRRVVESSNGNCSEAKQC